MYSIRIVIIESNYSIKQWNDHWIENVPLTYGAIQLIGTIQAVFKSITKTIASDDPSTVTRCNRMVVLLQETFLICWKKHSVYIQTFCNIIYIQDAKSYVSKYFHPPNFVACTAVSSSWHFIDLLYASLLRALRQYGQSISLQEWHQQIGKHRETRTRGASLGTLYEKVNEGNQTIQCNLS